MKKIILFTILFVLAIKLGLPKPIKVSKAQEGIIKTVLK